MMITTGVYEKVLKRQLDQCGYGSVRLLGVRLLVTLCRSGSSKQGQQHPIHS